MSQLNWRQNSTLFDTTCLDYKAIIKHNISTHEFDVALLTETDELIMSWEGFGDFEKAEEWVLFATIETEQNTLALGKQRMEETINLCRIRLKDLTDRIHLQRLNYIERWYFYQETQSSAVIEEAMKRVLMNKVEENPSQTSPSLDWQDKGTGLFAAPTSHGMAFIREIRKTRSPYVFAGKDTYSAYIEHRNGGRIDMGWEVTDFSEAEVWLQDRLRQLDDPRIAKEYMENITFTLNVCVTLFRNRQEVFHRARIEYLKDRAETVLP